jgi:hypothetical protein
MSATSTPDAKLPAPAVVPSPAPQKKPAGLPETTEGYPWMSNQEVKKESNPFTDKDWRMWLYAWAGMAVRLVLVAGAVFTVYQFLVAREEARVQRAFEMVELWEKPEYQAAQRAVKKRIDDLNAKYATILGNQAGARERSVVMGRIGLEAMAMKGDAKSQEEFAAEFDRVVYFLNRISFCVKDNLCSREVVDAYFADYAQSFWAYFADYVGEQRKSLSPTYAEPVEGYVSGEAEAKASE